MQQESKLELRIYRDFGEIIEILRLSLVGHW